VRSILRPWVPTAPVPEVSAGLACLGRMPNDDAPGEPGASRNCTDVDDQSVKDQSMEDQPSVSDRPKRLISGLIGWKNVTGVATLQLVF
jgi:hypothetical protein